MPAIKIHVILTYKLRLYYENIRKLNAKSLHVVICFYSCLYILNNFQTVYVFLKRMFQCEVSLSFFSFNAVHQLGQTKKSLKILRATRLAFLYLGRQRPGMSRQLPETEMQIQLALEI